MEKNKQKFEIETLIYLARLTEDQEKRDRFILQAEHLLEEYRNEDFFGDEYSLKKFIERYNKLPVKMQKIRFYRKYIDFCRQEKYQIVPQHHFFEFISEHGFCILKNGEAFKL